MPQSSKKTTTQKEDDKKKKKRKLFIIFFIILIALSVAGLGVLIFYLTKSCGGDKPKTDTYNIKVLQPEDKKHKLTVNGADNSLNVEFGTQLDIVFAPIQSNEAHSNYSCFDTTNDDPVVYYAQVSSQKDPSTEIWRSSALKQDGDKLVTSFKMNWTYDIVIQVNGESDFEKFIYTVDEDNKPKYTYGESLFDVNSPISRISTSTKEEETIPRDEFDDNLWVGKKVKTLDAHFLTSCSNFNSSVVFQSDGILETIGDNFMYCCSKFDQPITFPDSLKTILGNFMYSCSEFNQPIDTNKIEQIIGMQTTFLFCCTKFNSNITINSSLKAIPNYFLVGCTAFNQDITIPETIKTVGDGFMRNCDAMTHTIYINCPESAFPPKTAENICSTSNPNANCITIGMKAAGANGEKWKTRFPKKKDAVNNIYRRWDTDPWP